MSILGKQNLNRRRRSGFAPAVICFRFFRSGRRLDRRAARWLSRCCIAQEICDSTAARQYGAAWAGLPRWMSIDGRLGMEDLRSKTCKYARIPRNRPKFTWASTCAAAFTCVVCLAWQTPIPARRRYNEASWPILGLRSVPDQGPSGAPAPGRLPRRRPNRIGQLSVEFPCSSLRRAPA
jgi:hypothetical protein